MTTREKYQWLHQNVGTTARIISDQLNNEDKLPKRGRKYTRAIIHQVLIGAISDENVVEKIEGLYKRNNL